MPKRKQIDRAISDTQQQVHKKITPIRRSVRLINKIQKQVAGCKYLPSPASSLKCVHVDEPNTTSEYGNDPNLSKRVRLQDRAPELQTTAPRHTNFVAYWVHEDNELPKADYFDSAYDMATSRSNSKRRRSESSGTGRMTERREKMKECGICMDDTMRLNKASHKLCIRLLLGNREPAGFPVYQAKHRHKIRIQAATEAEAIIQRDILPTVVPSAQNLHMMEVIDIKELRDEVDALWSRASTMGDKQPKPDLAVGLRPSAFDQETWDKLINYATPDTPVLLSTATCFPLVIAEAKRGNAGLQEALYQVVHAGGIAVRQQIQLMLKAYGRTHAKVQELNGEALVFSVYHNHDEVNILAHYAVANEDNPEQFEYLYCKLGMYSLNMNNCRDQNKPYTFVENVYSICGPRHVERIRAAAKLLEAPASVSTGASFAFSELDMDNGDSVGDSQGATEGEAVFKKPKPRATATMSQELTMLRKMMEEQKEESKRREEESKRREEQLQTQLQQEREEMKMLIKSLASKGR